MYYITISNGLLEDKHYEKMGTAVWQFMWCIDKVTSIDDNGIGKVLGGKPIKLEDIPVGSRNTNSRNLHKLQKEGYIKLIHTPYGISIRVIDTKKHFQKRLPKNGEPKRLPNSGEPRLENGEPNKIIQLDKTTKTENETSSLDIGVIIKSFEGINPASKKFYKNTTQRKACLDLIASYGLERVKIVVEKTLPRTNGLQFFPTITTPLQLQDKWVQLESAIRKYQSEKKLTGVADINKK